MDEETTQKSPTSLPPRAPELSSETAAMIDANAKEKATESSTDSSKKSSGTKRGENKSSFPDKPSPGKRQRGVSTAARTEDDRATVVQQQGFAYADEPFPRAPMRGEARSQLQHQLRHDQHQLRQDPGSDALAMTSMSQRQLSERLQLQNYLQQQETSRLYGSTQPTPSFSAASVGLPGISSGSGLSHQQFSAIQQQQQQQQQQRWADMLLAGGSQRHSFPPSVNSYFTQNDQLRQFMQQQEMVRQLQEREATRRQLLFLRGSQANSSSSISNLGSPFGGHLPTMGNSSSAAMANHLLSRQQHDQHELSAMQQRISLATAGDHNSPRHGAASAAALPSDIPPSPNNPTRSPPRTRAVPSKSMARATPIAGFPPTPLPTPQQQPSKATTIPPIEENETSPYNERSSQIVPLGIEEDPNWLSEFQCFTRLELMEVFRASHSDVKIRVASKKVFYQQVGIRCRFCAHFKPNSRAIRSSAFPSSIRQLYQSFTMMLRDHFGNCTAMPQDLKAKFLELKRTNTQGASDSMRYWTYSANKLGLVDSSDGGIILTKQTQAAASRTPPFGTTPELIQVLTRGPARIIVSPEDKEKMSGFLYKLLTHYQMIRLLQSECIGNRKSLRPNIPGLGCRFCCQSGRLGLSRVFPAKKKQLPHIVQELYDHMRRCNLCPAELQEEFVKLYNEERQKNVGESTESEGEKLPIISDPKDKEFLGELWNRLGHKGELATPSLE